MLNKLQVTYRGLHQHY